MSNREIKFRGWDTDAKVMRMDVTGFEGVSGVMDGIFVDGNFRSITRGEMIPMQFTGLRDKNGKEIYEGDLLRVQSQYETDEPIDSAPNPVYFKDGSFRCGFHDVILSEKFCTGSDGHWNAEVIGNIYESPKFMEANNG